MKNINKKGNLDNIATAILLLFVSVSVIAAYLMINSSLTGFAGLNNTQATNLLTNGQTMILRFGNSSFGMIAFGLILINVIASFFLVTHPIFIIVDILLIPISLIISAALSNAYEASIYTMAAASAFPVMNFVMLNLPLIIFIGDVLTAIVAYALVKNA